MLCVEMRESRTEGRVTISKLEGRTHACLPPPSHPKHRRSRAEPSPMGVRGWGVATHPLHVFFPGTAHSRGELLPAPPLNEPPMTLSQSLAGSCSCMFLPWAPCTTPAG